MGIRKTLLLGITCMIMLTGCHTAEAPAETHPTSSGPRIGLSFDSLVIERWQRDRDTFVSRFKELGGEVYVQNANGDPDRQIEQINYFIDEKMDAIVIICADNGRLTNSVKQAKAAGIPVIAYDRLILNADVDLFVSFNNEKVGALMAASLVEHVPENGKILVVFGSPVDGNVNEAEKGFWKVIDKSTLQVMDKQYAIMWKEETGFQAVSDNLQKGNLFDGIYCGNDAIASQAVKALSEHRKAGDVWVVGQDAELIACQRIVEGTQGMTVYKSIVQEAKIAAEAAYALIQGEPPETTKTIFDGTYKVPYIELDPVAVTRENMDAVIVGDNYHLKEEIYMNLEQP